MIQARLSEPEEKVAGEERATLTKLQEELYSVEVSLTDAFSDDHPSSDHPFLSLSTVPQDGFETPAADLEGLAIEDDLNDEQLLDEGMAQSQPQQAVEKHDDDETF